MKKRTVEILMTVMQNANGKVFTAQLMQMYQISERTLKNDLKHINVYLASQQAGPVKISAEGKLLLPRDINRNQILESLGQEALKVYTLQPKEREILQFIMLLNAEKYVTVGEIADRLAISYVTTMNDISRLKEKFLTQGIIIKSSPGKGLWLEYTERSVRHVLISLLARCFEQLEGSYSVFQNIVLNQLDFVYTLDWIADRILLYRKKQGINLTEDGLKVLTLYLFVAINRCSKGFYVERKELSQNTDYDDKKLIAIYRGVAAEAGLEIREAELTVLHNDATILDVPKNDNPYEYQKAKTRVIDFINSISGQLGIDLYTDDVLLELLIQYFMNDRKLNTRLDEQLITQMRNDYPQVYQAVSESLDLVTEDVLYNDLEEITYIAMYLVAALERRASTVRRLKVLIACPGGVAVGQLLASRVRRIFNFNIVGISSANSLYYDDRVKNVDFVISAINIAKITKTVVVVDPLLSKEDINHIYEVSYTILNEKRRHNFNENNLETELTRLKKTVDAQIDPEKKSELEMAIKQLNSRFGQQKKKDHEDIKTLFQPEFVQRIETCTDWEEALRIAAIPLIEHGKISPEYVDATIDNCKMNGPYFVLREGFAIAHALPDKGMKEPCLGLLYVKEGVDFGHDFFGPVHMLFYTCFSEAGQWNHQILRVLIGMAESVELYQQISGADPQELYELIVNTLLKNIRE